MLVTHENVLQQESKVATLISGILVPVNFSKRGADTANFALTLARRFQWKQLLEQQGLEVIWNGEANLDLLEPGRILQGRHPPMPENCMQCSKGRSASPADPGDPEDLPQV